MSSILCNTLLHRIPVRIIRVSYINGLFAFLGNSPVANRFLEPEKKELNPLECLPISSITLSSFSGGGGNVLSFLLLVHSIEMVKKCLPYGLHVGFISLPCISSDTPLYAGIAKLIKTPSGQV